MALKKKSKTSSTRTEGSKRRKGGGLLGLAKKATKKKKSGSSNPTIRIDDPKKAEAIKRLSKNMIKEKDLKGANKADKALLMPLFDEKRVKYCRGANKVHTTVRLSMEDNQGDNYSVSVTQTNRYSPLDQEQKEDALEILEEMGAEDPDEEFDSRFNETIEIQFDKDQLKNPNIIERVEELLADNPWLGELLEVKQSWVPTAQFHEQRVMDEEEGGLFQALKDSRILRPYSPSFKA